MRETGAVSANGKKRTRSNSKATKQMAAVEASQGCYDSASEEKNGAAWTRGRTRGSTATMRSQNAMSVELHHAHTIPAIKMASHSLIKRRQ